MDFEIYKMVYEKVNNKTALIILGEEFVRNNGNKGLLIINNKKIKLPPGGIISLNNIKKNKIQMILNINIFNKSCMFKNCEALGSLSVFSLNDKSKTEFGIDNKINSEI